MKIVDMVVDPQPRLCSVEQLNIVILIHFVQAIPKKLSRKENNVFVMFLVKNHYDCDRNSFFAESLYLFF